MLMDSIESFSPVMQWERVAISRSLIEILDSDDKWRCVIKTRSLKVSKKMRIENEKIHCTLPNTEFSTKDVEFLHNPKRSFCDDMRI